MRVSLCSQAIKIAVISQNTFNPPRGFYRQCENMLCAVAIWKIIIISDWRRLPAGFFPRDFSPFLTDLIMWIYTVKVIKHRVLEECSTRFFSFFTPTCPRKQRTCWCNVTSFSVTLGFLWSPLIFCIVCIEDNELISRFIHLITLWLIQIVWIFLCVMCINTLT